MERDAARRCDAWTASPVVREHLNERTSADPARDWLSGWAPQFFTGVDLRVLLAGGDAGLERAIAEWPFVSRVDAFAGLTGVALDSDAYDVVIADMTLHRTPEINETLAQLERAMKDDSFLIVNDYTGPKHFQHAGDVLAMVKALAAAAGIRHASVAADPLEAVSSDELLPALYEHFDVVDIRRIGGTLLQYLGCGIADDFRDDDPVERSLAQLLCTLEAALVDGGALPSDYNLVAARKRGSGAIPVQRPVAAPPVAGEALDPDPLRMRRRLKSEGRAAGELHPWHLRILRIALASTQPRRARRFEEQPMHAAMERFRFALARTSAFDWIISRYRAYGRDARMLALLETFDRLAPE